MALGGTTSMHGLSWSVAFPSESSWVEHVLVQALSSANWPVPHPTMPIGQTIIEEPSTFLMPNLAPFLQDVLVSTGGQYGWGHLPNAITNDVWLLDTKLANPVWTPGPAMHYPRKFHKTLILPDLSMLTIGGGQDAGHGGAGCEDFWPEVFLHVDNQWHFCAKEQSGVIPSPRTYHSCAVLLPTGEVLSCGGDTRQFDYQVFRPHYLDGNPVRPRWGSDPQLPATINYGQSFAFSFRELPPLQSILRVVLTSPGSWTHAQDPGQRAVQLTFTAGKYDGTALAPPSASHAPAGLYMIWLVSSAGTPSEAGWVRLQ